MTPRQQAALEALAHRFDHSYPHRGPHRRVGRECEYPVVTPDGRPYDIQPLLAALRDQGGFAVKTEGALITQLDGPEASYAAEVGRGTIEIILPPHEDLVQLTQAAERATRRAADLARAQGARLLGYGIQPLQPGTPDFMAPKQRYGVLLEVLGPIWLLFTLTASDQVHLEASREDWVLRQDLGNLLAPLTVALCANSPIFEGRDQGFCSSREGQMGRIGADVFRHGMPGGPAHTPVGFIHQKAVQPFLMRRRGGQLLPCSGSFLGWCDREDLDPDTLWDDYLVHEHYIWNAARPRPVHGTIEMRSACQQPPDEHWAASVLGVAILCAAPALGELVHGALGNQAWPRMRAWHHQVMREGLAAPEPAPGFLAAALGACEDALRARGRGEEALLAPLWRRLEARENPAQRARRLWAAGGVEALVEAYGWG